MWVNKDVDTGHIIYANFANKAQLEDWNWLEIPTFAIVKAQPTPLPKRGDKLTCFLEARIMSFLVIILALVMRR